MKNLLFSLSLLVLFNSQNVKAQNDGAAAAAIAGGLVAIGAGIAAIEDMKEQVELTATEWLLENHPEIKSFSLKNLNFEGKKTKDMSNVSVLTFKLQEFTPSDNIKLDGRKQILFAFTSYGWISEQGVDFSKVSWYLIDEKEWMNMMVAYSKVASNEKSENVLREKISDGTVVNKGVRVKNKMEVPFFKLEGDMYLVTDYSEDMKFVYNERSLGIYLRKTGNLVQIKRNTIVDIHEYLLGKK